MTDPVLPSDLIVTLIDHLNARRVEALVALYSDTAVIATARGTFQGPAEIRRFYTELLAQAPQATFTLAEARDVGVTACNFKWRAAAPNVELAEGDDTVAVLNNKLQYHNMLFTLRPKTTP